MVKKQRSKNASVDKQENVCINNWIFSILVRSSVGVELWHATGASNTYTTHEKFARDESKFCRAIEFSSDGRYLAWANGTKYVYVIIYTYMQHTYEHLVECNFH